jgi:arylsulfatase A-like enzyme
LIEHPPNASTLPEDGRRLLLFGLWFSLVAALAELALLGAKKFLLHRFIFLGVNAVWMTPAADVVIFAVPALALYVVSSRSRRFNLERIGIGVFAFLTSLSVLLLYYPLHALAKLALAAGLAVQTARVVSAHREAFHLLVRRSIGWMAGAWLAAAVFAYAWPRATELVTLRRLPPAPPQAPNVLLITLDTVRARSLSLYGYARRTTPFLETLASKSVVFDRAFSTAPWTLPSHGSLFTGRYPDQLSVDWARPLDATHPTLAERFSARGYATAGFVANPQYAGYETGLNRGFSHFEDYMASPGELLRSAAISREVVQNAALRQKIRYYEFPGRKTAEDVNREFLNWVGRHDERPFFAFLNYIDAHDPYLPPAPFDTMFGPHRPRPNAWLKWGWQWTPEQIQTERDAYDGAIAYLDHRLSALFAELERRGLLQNTLVVVTADHGEEFGVHGLMKHGYSLYVQALHVPLLISFPGRVPAGRRVDEPVTLRDVPATIIDLSRLDDARAFPGTTLSRYWTGNVAAGRENVLSKVTRASNNPGWYPVSKGDLSSVVFGSHHYIRNGDLTEELYDIENDPRELQNLARCHPDCTVLEQFRTAMKESVDERQP